MFIRKVISLDARLTDSIRLKNPATNRFKPFAASFSHSGDSWFVEIALLLIWLFSTSNLHLLAALMAGAVAILAVLVLGIKFTIRRRRPDGDWGAVYRNTDPYSFPSGHASRTSMLAVLALLLGFTWLGIILLIWMALVSIARVWMGVHYLSDILAGMVLGAAFALLMAALAPWFYSILPWIFSDRTSLIAFQYFHAILA